MHMSNTEPIVTYWSTFSLLMQIIYGIMCILSVSQITSQVLRRKCPPLQRTSASWLHCIVVQASCHLGASALGPVTTSYHVPRLMHQPPTIHRVKQKRSARLDFLSLRVERGHSFRRSSQFPFQMDWGWLGQFELRPITLCFICFLKVLKENGLFPTKWPQCWAKFLNFQHDFSRRSSPLVHIPRTGLGFIHSIPFPSVFVGENHV